MGIETSTVGAWRVVAATGELDSGVASRCGWSAPRATVERVLRITGANPVLDIDVDAPGREPHGREVTADAVEAILAARAALSQADERRDVLREHALRKCLPKNNSRSPMCCTPHRGAP